ncbi:MAG: putative toxin-antitoxin system toxin component, PIN family [Candidatus Omnitrophica bacterium]|nr:putative toxin-antitoxin system toxin component, PIN family [Candidatus Omnitrophota bacterium]
MSGLLSPAGPSAALMNRLTDSAYQLYLSRAIFTEYGKVIHQFVKIPKTKREKILGRIRHRAVWVRPETANQFVLRDPSDDKFIQCVLAAQADFLVTGDKDLLSISSRKVGGAYILSLVELNEIMGWG